MTGITRFCFGVAKKVLLADPMGGIADSAFSAGAGSLATFSAWIGVIAFAFHIYFLFSAFADMAIGLTRLLGIESSESFDSPYKCDSITDFWRRWLIPPLGNGRGGLMLTVFIGALLHRSPWGLVIWAGLHVGLLSLERMTGRDAFYSGLVKPVKVAITFFFLLITWVFFRADTSADAVSYLAVLFGFGPPLATTSALLDADLLRNFNTVHLVAAALVVWVMPNTQTILRKFVWWKALTGLVLLALAIVQYSGVSICPSFILQHKQSWLAHSCGEGNARVHVGTGGWLFDKSEITALVGRGPLKSASASTKKESRMDKNAVIEFANQLKQRGVPLLLVPVPAKASIYPEYLSSEKFRDPVYHPEQLALYEQLRAAGADVIDLAPEMWRLKLRKQVFLKQDTHWTPDAMKVMAEFIVKHIRTKYPQALPSSSAELNIDARLLDRTSQGDLTGLLDLPASVTWMSEEQVTLVSISGLDPNENSPFALLGDSLVNVFDDPTLGFATDDELAKSQRLKAGFGNQLAILLNEPLDVIAVNEEPAEALREFAKRDEGNTPAKKLVVWVFAATDLLAP